ncbi:MAG: DUF309 domain-containing protein [Ktedonobacterales bacterium]|nr:DUF309 domain-containing protein [Ktedonobacterales bacterium]
MLTDEDCLRCADAPDPLLLAGVRLFNAHHYFECHEVLETAWNAEHAAIRVLYKGILQVGVGCYHLLRGNYRGAVIKLASGADYLEPFAPICMTVDVAHLISAARSLREVVVAAGPDAVASFDHDLLPTIHLIS